MLGSIRLALRKSFRKRDYQFPDIYCFGYSNKEVKHLKIGVVGSSGGSALATAHRCLIDANISVDWIVLTDRECELRNWAQKNAKVCENFVESDNQKFSSMADQFFEKNNCDQVLLFFTRLVCVPLITNRHVYNIHPALLPSFKGLNGLKDALDSNVKVFGATLHHVDSGMDTGRIIGQVAAPTGPSRDEAELSFISYQQKVWLTLVFYEYLINQTIDFERKPIWPSVLAAAPGLGNEKLRKAFIQVMDCEKSQMVG